MNNTHCLYRIQNRNKNLNLINTTIYTGPDNDFYSETLQFLHDIDKLTPNKEQRECIQNAVVKRKHIFARLPTGNYSSFPNWILFRAYSSHIWCIFLIYRVRKNIFSDQNLGLFFSTINCNNSKVSLWLFKRLSRYALRNLTLARAR